jgi:hypothetical protein
VHEGKHASKDLLKSNSVYIVKSESEFWTWIGNKSSIDDRKLSYLVVEKLQNEIEGWTIWARVPQNGETVLFKQNFYDFPGTLPISLTQEQTVSNISERKEQKEIDIDKLFGNNKTPSVIYDDGFGKVIVYRIEGFGKIQVPENYNGHFWEGESLLILYTYVKDNKESSILYYWQGRECSINEKGTSALLTKEMNDLLGGKGKQIRVVEQFEENHFLLIFHGRLIYHHGKFTENWAEATYLYDVRHDPVSKTNRAAEIDLSSTSLHTGHCFVLQSPKCIYIWNGNYSLPEERDFALAFANELTPFTNSSIISIFEGEEPAEFWDNFHSGKEEYYKIPPITNLSKKIFVVSNVTGVIEIHEENHFFQDTLDFTKAYIVDTIDAVWVWFGTHSKFIEQKWGIETAMKYLEKSPYHEKNTPINVTKSYEEPIQFTSHFQGWNRYHFPDNAPTDIYNEVAETVLKEYLRTTYSYMELTSENLPKGIDVSQKEIYLSDEDFESIFNMKKEDYEKIPSWRRETLKKKVRLY